MPRNDRNRAFIHVRDLETVVFFFQLFAILTDEKRVRFRPEQLKEQNFVFDFFRCDCVFFFNKKKSSSANQLHTELL